MALNYKQAAFVAEYLIDFNATQAAIRAGYSERTAGAQGHRLLKNVEIAAAIHQHLEERTIPAAEVLARLSDQARGSAADYLSIDDYGYVRLDLEKMKREGKLHLVHAYKATKQGTEVKLYDAQSALVHLGKHYGLFTDDATKTWRDEVIDLLRRRALPLDTVWDELGDELASELFDAAGVSRIKS